MFLPVGDMPNPRGTPVVNYLLIGINIAIFVLFTLPLSTAHPDFNDPAFMEYIRAIPMYQNIPMERLLAHITAYDLFIFEHGFKPAHPSLNDLFSSIFLHAGFLHLFGNMLFLWIYGDNVEHRLGSLLYLVLYVATGIMATLFYTLFQLQSTIPMVGASGAISGVLGFYFIWFPKNKVRVLIMLFPFFMDVIMLPARLVLGFYLIVDNLLPFFFSSGGSGGVAHGAHIGGFLAGLGLAITVDKVPDLIRPRRWKLAGASPDKSSPPDPKIDGQPLADRIHRALQNNDYARAVSDYFNASSSRDRKTLFPSDRLQIGNYLLREGHDTEALTLFRHYISDYPNGPYLDRAYLGAGMALYEGKGQLTSAYQYFLSVLDCEPEPESEVKARRYIATIQAMQKLPFRGK